MENDPGLPKRGEGVRAAALDISSVDRCQFDISVLLARLSLRQLHFVYRHFDGDMTLAIVLGEVALHNVSRFQNTDTTMAPGSSFWDREDLKKILLPCNALSISQSTNIPRETVRRKIARLVAWGWMEQNQKGEVTITRSVCQKFAPEFNADLISSILVASNGIRDMIEKSPTKAPVHSIRPDNRPQPSA